MPPYIRSVSGRPPAGGIARVKKAAETSRLSVRGARKACDASVALSHGPETRTFFISPACLKKRVLPVSTGKSGRGDVFIHKHIRVIGVKLGRNIKENVDRSCHVDEIVLDGDALRRYGCRGVSAERYILFG